MPSSCILVYNYRRSDYQHKSIEGVCSYRHGSSPGLIPSRTKLPLSCSPSAQPHSRSFLPSEIHPSAYCHLFTHQKNLCFPKASTEAPTTGRAGPRSYSSTMSPDGMWPGAADDDVVSGRGLSRASKRRPLILAQMKRHASRSARAPKPQSRPPRGAATKAPDDDAVSDEMG